MKLCCVLNADHVAGGEVEYPVRLLAAMKGRNGEAAASLLARRLNLPKCPGDEADYLFWLIVSAEQGCGTVALVPVS